MATAAEAAKRGREDGDVIDGLGDVPSDAQKLRLVEDRKPKRWTPEEDEVLRVAVEKHGQRNWKLIAAEVEGRNHGQCQQRWNKVLKPGLVKGHWSEEEDAILKHMALQGCHSWTDVSAQIPGRTPKQCRERWRNHLDPSIDRSPFTPEEDFTIQQAYEQLGNRWTKIAELVPGRTEDAVKTRWKTLNPYRKTNDRPGRPRRMPGLDDVVNPLLGPDNPMAVGHDPVVHSHAYNALASMLLSMVPAEPAVRQHNGGGTGYVGGDLHAASMGESDLPEPIVEPLQGDFARLDSKDAAILRELLLRSQSSSIMSFGSARDMSSFADVSPDELLASGELDEMLKAVSFTSRDGGTDDSSMMSSGSSSNKTSAQALIKKLRHLSNNSDDDKHIFQELIDAVRAATSDVADASESNRSLDIFSTDSGRDLLHSLEFGSSVLTTSAEVGALDDDEYDEDEDEDEGDEDDLLRPIHIGKRSTAAGGAEQDGFSDLLKPIHLGKHGPLTGPDSSF